MREQSSVSQRQGSGSTSAPKRSKPAFNVYIESRKERKEGSKPLLIRVGFAYAHREGNGLNIELADTIRLETNRLVMFPPADDDAEPTD